MEYPCRQWKHRRPPDGLVESQLMLCIMPQPCIFGDQCKSAHSEGELREWKSRLPLENQFFAYDNVTHEDLQLDEHRASLQKKLVESADEKSVLTEIIGGYTILCDENLFIMHVDKDKELAWMFTITKHVSTEKELERVFFLNDCAEFSMEYVFFSETEFVKLPKQCKIWKNTNGGELKVLRILIRFCAPKYGNFCQEIVFDFGSYPKVVRKLGVQVANEETLAETMQYNPEKFGNNELSWLQKHKVVAFDGCRKEKDVIMYPLPPNIETLVVFDAFKHLDLKLTKQNYRTRLHTLLYIEEYQRRANLQSIAFHMDEFAVCLEKPSKKAKGNVTAKILYDEFILEDLSRLVGKSGKALLHLNSFEHEGKVNTDVEVHEVVIQSIQNNILVLELSDSLSSIVSSSAIPVDIDVCFCLIDIFQTLHQAIDKVETDLVFPQNKPTNSFPYSADLPSNILLSTEQNRAVKVILDERQTLPVLLLGPFGAGKTRTLAHAVKQILFSKPDKHRVLVCTHSNSAADYYIEEYFHPLHIRDSNKVTNLVKPLRINWEHRYTSSVSDKVLAYCWQDKTTGFFALPTKEELDEYNLVISTLVTSVELFKLNLPNDYFTHIIIDEAAQAMEVEAIVPLLLANTDTKIVLAGDHMQMSEPLSSSVAADLGLGKSLLERLFELYPFDADCKLKLLENFRSYKEIVDVSSHLFYEDALISNKIKPDDAKYPLEFYGVTGIEVLSKENPSYENIAEGTEIMLRITDLIKFWEGRDVDVDLKSICVVSFYPAQVRRIRKILRRNDLGEIRVESVNNIQGLEFDTMIISTVRTRCDTTLHDEVTNKDMGFLTNPKLLNTAITRARYQVIIVGDPVALCTIGDCKPCWKTLLRICNENGSFSCSNNSYEEVTDTIRNLTNDVSDAQTNSDSVGECRRSSTISDVSFGGSDTPSYLDSPPPPYTPYSPVNPIPMHFQSPYHFTPDPRMFRHCSPRHGFQFGYVHPPFMNMHGMPVRWRAPPVRPCFLRPQMVQGDCARPYFFRHHQGFFPPRFGANFRMHLFSGSHNQPGSRMEHPVNFYQKLQYTQEYCHYLMEIMQASAELKELVMSNLETASKQVKMLNDNFAMYDENLAGTVHANIKSLVENAHLFTENQFTEYMKLMQAQNCYSDVELKRKYGLLRKRISELKIFVEHEQYETDVLKKYADNAETRKNVASLLYFVSLLETELNSCNYTVLAGHILHYKMTFIEQQILVAEANRDQLEEQVNVGIVEDVNDSSYKASEMFHETEIHTTTVLPPTALQVNAENPNTPLYECEIGAIENNMAAMTIEDEDPDLVNWFTQRRNDPCVQEYVTSSNRQHAERLPSPTSGIGDVGRKKCKFMSKMQKGSQAGSCFLNFFKNPFSTDDARDYSMNPPYPPYADEKELRTLPSVYEGNIRYLDSDNPDKIHGAVYVTHHSLQVHINGLRRNNRSLPGDKVLVKIRSKHTQYDVSGAVLKVLQRSSSHYTCEKLNEDLVYPEKEFGPPILLVRGIGCEKQDLDETKLYVVKIIDWPENMRYPLGEIIEILERARVENA